MPFRYQVHALIYRVVLWYVERRGGVLHALPYKTPKRYLVAMGENDYVRWVALKSPPAPAELYSIRGRRQGRLWKSP
jgi:hypothetical protein